MSIRRRGCSPHSIGDSAPHPHRVPPVIARHLDDLIEPAALLPPARLQIPPLHARQVLLLARSLHPRCTPMVLSRSSSESPTCSAATTRSTLTFILTQRGPLRGRRTNGTMSGPRRPAAAAAAIARRSSRYWRISPSHTAGDGDTVFSLATGRWTGEADVTLVGALAAEALADAVVRAATQATSVAGISAARDLKR